MVIVKFLIFYTVFKMSFSENILEEPIVEGLKTYTIESSTIYTFIFKAADNGAYVIIFPDFAKIMEATGQINRILTALDISLLFMLKNLKREIMSRFFTLDIKCGKVLLSMCQYKN